MLATRNGGLVAKLDRNMRAFDEAPILSPQEYKEEMLEISKMAEKLSVKLKKFNDAYFLYDPFVNQTMFSREQIETIAEKLVNPKFFESKKSYQSERSITAHLLDHYLPPFNVQLHNLSMRAKSEFEDPHHRLHRLPRKVSDNNVFRTYFISVVRNIFLADFGDGSHTRLATFCSVALDDPEITPNLVRKISPIDDDTKEWLKELRNYKNPED